MTTYSQKHKISILFILCYLVLNLKKYLYEEVHVQLSTDFIGKIFNGTGTRTRDLLNGQSSKL